MSPCFPFPIRIHSFPGSLHWYPSPRAIAGGRREGRHVWRCDSDLRDCQRLLRSALLPKRRSARSARCIRPSTQRPAPVHGVDAAVCVPGVAQSCASSMQRFDRRQRGVLRAVHAPLRGSARLSTFCAPVDAFRAALTLRSARACISARYAKQSVRRCRCALRTLAELRGVRLSRGSPARRRNFVPRVCRGICPSSMRRPMRRYGSVQRTI